MTWNKFGTEDPHIQGIHKRMVRFRKWTRNLFLTLYAHNVHRQQQQLSKFLMRYQQFDSHAYCGAAGPVSKMASKQEKALCAPSWGVQICDYSAGHLKTEHTKPFPAWTPSWKLAPRPPSKHGNRTDGSAWETWTVAAADGVRCARIRWEINFWFTFETAPFFCVYPVLRATLPNLVPATTWHHCSTDKSRWIILGNSEETFCHWVRGKEGR